MPSIVNLDPIVIKFFKRNYPEQPLLLKMPAPHPIVSPGLAMLKDTGACLTSTLSDMQNVSSWVEPTDYATLFVSFSVKRGCFGFHDETTSRTIKASSVFVPHICSSML